MQYKKTSFKLKDGALLNPHNCIIRKDGLLHTFYDLGCEGHRFYPNGEFEYIEEEVETTENECLLPAIFVPANVEKLFEIATENGYVHFEKLKIPNDNANCTILLIQSVYKKPIAVGFLCALLVALSNKDSRKSASLVVKYKDLVKSHIKGYASLEECGELMSADFLSVDNEEKLEWILENFSALLAE